MEEHQPTAMRCARPDGVWKRFLGHLWTVAPAARDQLVGTDAPQATPWMGRIPNEFGDSIIRYGLFRDVPQRDVLVVVLHGMGGSVDRGYCAAAAQAADRAGLPCLRLSLRGADGMGTDLHHAGFIDDLAPILGSPEFERFQKVALVGYSLGGHVALTAGGERVDERLVAVAAICPPMELEACQQCIDSPGGWLYRRHLLRGLKETYAAIARGDRAPAAVSRIHEVRSLREWDRLTVVPRFGFRDVAHYYETQSVGPKLTATNTSNLVVASPADPMIPADSVRGHLGRASNAVVVRWVRDGGHVFFPPEIDLGFGARMGVENQVMHWVEAQFTTGT